MVFPKPTSHVFIVSLRGCNHKALKSAMLLRIPLNLGLSGSVSFVDTTPGCYMVGVRTHLWLVIGHIYTFNLIIVFLLVMIWGGFHKELWLENSKEKNYDFQVSPVCNF